jgi:hypothetical protein
MVFPYPKSLVIYSVVSSIFLCGFIMYSIFMVIVFVYLFRLLTSG